MRRLFPLAAASVALLGTALVAVPADAATWTASFARWTSTAELKKGTVSSTAKVVNDSVALASGTSGTWTSPWQSAGSSKTLVPSWSASTPKGSKLKVEARVRSGSKTGSWDTVATWAWGTETVKRTSHSSQTDDLAKVATDTVVASSGKTFSAWQLRFTLQRTSSKGASPVLQSANGVAAPYATRSRATSATTMSQTVELAVPTLSQMIHRNHYKQYDGGGAAWCSPTTISMLLGAAGLGPAKSVYAYTKESEGYVDWAAALSYDYRYKGTGNWSFSTAYAAAYGADAYVTRLDSFAEAEQLIKAGVPIGISVAFKKGQLSGAPLSSTPGHLLVVRGFRADGAVIVNDPAAPSSASVRRVYNRAQLEKAWQTGSGGITYVVKKPSVQLTPTARVR